ncbi:tRNA (guanosine(37)-N1)-methyltransferase TrmD [Candidatus Curtissbacteria bacterium RIFCSPHIGHO2_12_FULL_38_9b]|uniref:tRNA (guanine-N(1)-)-methyltransferase n=2 Tax=Candidatus Curtissiibacteriota TaxID=1752717 RepID=A0A1F5GY91_9BACT|nr:MAG: tRNA (guanosine(37)-N1)-methyltransferase TrmD [Candidatus Curtissbacteria bacterium RIFCSPLOWO2_01_FULL_37_9]OGD96755.1 MAG: tRNA (guanosine(37)-N1)-methyltransferase TrmD [Candidatus Curtissbacteria bacterium RIFCSPHIGHO2_12_FULL_38_9b]
MRTSGSLNINVITLFPQMFNGVITKSIINRAIQKKIVSVNFINLRNFANDKHKTVDDKPYGGGRGMLLKVDVTVKALESIKLQTYKILLSASGQKYNQKLATDLAKKKDITIICGHYEGIDSRIEKFVDQSISIGDFILSGGEIAAMVIIDSIIRLIPGVIHKESSRNESFSDTSAFLEYPQYTRPDNFRGLKVPKILLSGNHQAIKSWQNIQSVKRTEKIRPDLIKTGNK